MAKIFTDQNFEEEIIGVPGIVLVDFWAPWCGPCQMMGPIIDELAAELEGKAIVGKINVDENPLITERYGIMSIPTIIIFKDGIAVDQLVGAQSKETLVEKLKLL